MASRRNIPPLNDRHITPAPEMTRRGLLPAVSHSVEPLTHVLLDKKLADQAAEIELLSEDNHKLACSHISLRQDLVAAHREVEKLREHIRSIQTEGNIQIRILLDKTGNMEANIRAGDNISKELQEARVEAQSLVEAKLQLTAQIQRATNELDTFRADVKKLPEMHSELDSLRQEHKRLCKVFEHEKGLNIEKVEQMKIMEKDLIHVVEEVERLRAEVLDAENWASAPIPYNTPRINSDYMYLPTFHGNGGLDNFSRPFPPLVGLVGGGTNPFASSGYASLPSVVNRPVISGTGIPGWGGTFDASHIQRILPHRYDQIHDFPPQINNSSNIDILEKNIATRGSQCHEADIQVIQWLRSTNGIPKYTVMITNMCNTNCVIADLHLHCGWFSSARLVNPKLFKRVEYNDCLVNGGEPIPYGHVVEFHYENTYPFSLSIGYYTCLP